MLKPSDLFTLSIYGSQPDFVGYLGPLCMRGCPLCSRGMCRHVIICIWFTNKVMCVDTHTHFYTGGFSLLLFMAPMIQEIKQHHEINGRHIHIPTVNIRMKTTVRGWVQIPNVTNRFHWALCMTQHLLISLRSLFISSLSVCGNSNLLNELGSFPNMAPFLQSIV